MNKLTAIFLASSAFALTACGGSSNNHTTMVGSGSDSHPDTGTHTPEKSIRGLVDSGTGLVEVSGAELHSINVNGKAIQLNIPGLYAGNMYDLTNVNSNGRNYQKFQVSGSFYEHSKFGYIVDGDGTEILFSQGEPTANMPTQGNATYKGSSVYVDRKKQTVLGSSELNADFAKKVISGEFKGRNSAGENIYDIDFNAKINGNTFRDTGTGIATVEGRFYGENAAEAGGIFKAKDASFKGAFGAFK